jgi:hypothetical protein
MENNPLYRLYLQLKDRVDVLSLQGNVGGSGNSPDVSELIVRLRTLENRPTNDSIVNDLVSSVEVLKRENEQLKLKLEAVNKFENIENRLYNLETEPKVQLEPLTQRVTQLENTDYNERITALESRLFPVEQYSNQIPDLTYRVNDMEKRPDLSERLNALESTVASLKM